ncbi:hypothetical protein BCR35DRAFT_299663 [Leucosporidium creatinivorum]|uniref:PPPDE domain-containing protein n=1 Tax=Leucosporidium creatinivorum TaxID=106004 RepID=A0A1Y2G0D5_9BASI|nr:hypothetical protein BCR35DRAFT_299663 [Leucosporidium creatinivorum]
MRVRIRVYDLLPEGKLSWALNLVGTGVYHSSVELAIPRSPLDVDSPAPLEYAFGGHDVPGATGVFSIPAGTAAVRMGPSLRPYLTLDVGEAFGDDWRSAFGPKRRRKSKRTDSTSSSLRPKLQQYGSEATLAGPPYGGAEGGSPSQLSLMTSVDDAFLEGDQEEEDDWNDDGGESDGTQYLTVEERRAWRILERMRIESEWHGTSYRLLGHNCNSFTDELVWRLTGRRAPAWLNRAAWVATSIPCIVPPGWIDEADEAAPDAPAPTSPAAVGSTVVAAPPRADRMTVGRG